MCRCYLPIAYMFICIGVVHAQTPESVQLPMPPTRAFLLSPEVVEDKDGTLRLARSVLLAHGLGATDFHQGETLNDNKWAKTSFNLENIEVADAELFFFGSAKQVSVNGTDLPAVDKLKS